MSLYESAESNGSVSLENMLLTQIEKFPPKHP